MADNLSFSSDELAAVRKDFPILSRCVHGDVPLAYLDNAASTQRPRQVIEAIVDVYENRYANVHRGIHTLADETTELYENAREAVRRFVNARSYEEIVFTSGATAAINLVARSWGDANLGEGDEILVTEMEHHSNLVPWFQLAERTGAIVKHVPITEDGRIELEEFSQRLTDRTKLVAVTAVSNVLGTINPIAEMVSITHDAGALILVDGAQGVPHQKTDVQALDVDFLVAGGHKMLGPSGIGFLYAKRELLEAMPPFMGGGSMIRDVYLDRFTPGDLPSRFEAGTPPIVPAIGMTPAIAYLERIGFDRIAAHERRLVVQTHEMFEALGGIRILGPSPEHKAGIVSFLVEGVHAHDVAQLLDRHGVAVRAGHHCAQPLHERYGVSASARASFYFYNTPEEVERLGEAIEQARAVFRRRKSRR
ncbi:MAG: cysteine desulfurase [Planctomycetota bacterium]|nr:MAG: cysteine desulfurase [Planctomycetota bacterium]